jgi:hypothetical protein
LRLFEDPESQNSGIQIMNRIKFLKNNGTITPYNNWCNRFNSGHHPG